MIGTFRYAVDDLDCVHLFYTMADLSIEEILDYHVQAPVEIEKVEKTFSFESLLHSVI
jgi:hypothetical protein